MGATSPIVADDLADVCSVNADAPVLRRMTRGEHLSVMRSDEKAGTGKSASMRET